MRTALEGEGKGRVLVVDGGGSKRCALVGDQLAQLGVTNGWAGIVVYGCIRDSAEIAGMALGIKALGTGGRLVTLGGGGGATPFEALGRELLSKELEIMGSRYCTRQEVSETLELAARGDIWPLVTETCPFDAKAALTIHERLEGGDILGRAALMIGEEGSRKFD